MAWFASHQEFKDDPRTLDLMTEMGWDLDVCIGKWHRLIWWCINYAEDGILSNHKLTSLTHAIGLPPEEGEKLKHALINSGYATIVPDFRITDWWTIMGRFLQVKYKKNRKMWERIRALYISETDLLSELEEKELGTVVATVPITPNNTVHDIKKDDIKKAESTKEYNTTIHGVETTDIRNEIPSQLDLLFSKLEIEITDEEFILWYKSINQLIENKNATRPHNRFSWSSSQKQSRQEMRTLVYKYTKDEKREILMKVFQLTGKEITWLEFLTKVITITVIQDELDPVLNPIGFAFNLIKKPEWVVSNHSTGVWI